ncbi:MAG: hypothetical protein EHM33_01040 [Chloroflexi bacterium]|nr:MAG: hypothetical protein EHM33_01040 [Chloroflexota bacterium]
MNYTTNDIYRSEFGTQTEAQKTPEVQVALKEMDKVLEELEQSLQGLVARLVPVMGPEYPQKDNPVPNVQQPHSDVYNHINNIRGRLASVVAALVDIKQRLEV